MSEKISDDNTTDFVKLTGGLLANINYKVAAIMMAVGLLIFSDIFVGGFMSGVEGATFEGDVTSKGTVLQLLIFVMVYIIADVLVKYEVL